MKLIKYRSFQSLFLLAILLYLPNIFSVEIDSAQEELLNSLPPDQRDSIRDKMEESNKLNADLKEIFENPNILIEKEENNELEEELKCQDCIFGYNFFKYSPSTFAPLSDTQVANDYVLGPGDKLEVNYYGNNEENFKGFISREGNLNIPLTTPVNLMGLTFEEAKRLIENKVNSELIGTQASISLSEMRSISVYLLGQAFQPGKYTLSALSTVTNALFVTGGVTDQGSLRNISIRRGNKEISNYDFYDFLLKGSLDQDKNLEDGDIIFIPFIDSTIKMGSGFRRPHLYEIKQGETLKDAINMAGGIIPFSQKSNMELSTIEESTLTRSIKSIGLDDDYLVKNGDVLNIPSKSGIESSTVLLGGEVQYPGEYSIRFNDSLLDIIQRAGGFTERGYLKGAVFTRKSVAENQKEAFRRSADELEKTIINLVSSGSSGMTITEFTLSPITQLIQKLRKEEPIGRQVINLDMLKLKTDPLINFKLQNGDYLFIPERPNSITVTGEVLNFSSHAFDPSLTFDDYLSLSGGLAEQADKNRIFIIYPDGKAKIVRRTLFNKTNEILPGSTIVVPRDTKPYDAIKIAEIVTPILANLATSAAAIAAISDN